MPDVFGFPYKIEGNDCVILDRSEYFKKIDPNREPWHPLVITRMDSFAWQHTITDQDNNTKTYYESPSMKWKGDHFVILGGRTSTDRFRDLREQCELCDQKLGWNHDENHCKEYQIKQIREQGTGQRL